MSDLKVGHSDYHKVDMSEHKIDLSGVTNQALIRAQTLEEENENLKAENERLKEQYSTCYEFYQKLYEEVKQLQRSFLRMHELLDMVD